MPRNSLIDFIKKSKVFFPPLAFGYNSYQLIPELLLTSLVQQREKQWDTNWAGRDMAGSKLAVTAQGRLSES